MRCPVLQIGVLQLAVLLALGPSLGARAQEAAPAVADQPAQVGESAAPPVPPAVDSVTMLALRARLERLRAAVKREATVRTAVEQADLALARARTARAQANEARALRAEQLAEAATTLAERRLARVREIEATTSVLARRKEARALAKAARGSLAVAEQRAVGTEPAPAGTGLSEPVHAAEAP